MGPLVRAVRSLAQACVVLFVCASAASAQGTTTFVFDSEPGDLIGGGRQETLTAATHSIAASVGSANTLTFTIASLAAPGNALWTIKLGAPRLTALSEGVYEGALINSGAGPSLEVYPCAGSFGRFVVRQLVMEGTTVVRAAVDLEQHCWSADAGFFAAVRFNSTIVESDVIPFDGIYPTYRLTLTAPSNGTITGGGLNCGSSGTACDLSPSSPLGVPLIAVPDPGYAFAGWTGRACYGFSTLTVRVNTVKECSAAFEPLITSTPRSRALLDHSSGTSAPPQREVLSELTTNWSGFMSADHRKATFQILFPTASGGYSARTIVFSAPQGQTLQPGTSYAALGLPTTTIAGMDAGLSCSRLTGRFVVRDLVEGTFGSIEHAAIDFEQHCDDSDAGVFGSVRYHSALDAVPFGGDYPRYRLVIPAPSHGRVTGAGIDCGGAGTACESDFAGPTTVALTATPDAGYEFAGWSDSCHGGAAITFRLNTVKQCAPIFEAASAPAPRKRLTMVSRPGEAILQGRTEIYSAPNSIWSTFASAGSVSFAVNGIVDAAETTWTLTFGAASGQILASGAYTNAASVSSPTRPSLQVSGNGRSCTVTDSSFTIHDLELDGEGGVLRARIDFDQHCDAAGSAALSGSIEYVIAEPSGVTLDKSQLSYAVIKHDNGLIGRITAPQTVHVSMRPGGGQGWTAVSSVPWLQILPPSGIGSQPLSIGLQPSAGGMEDSTVVGTVTVTAEGGRSATVTVVAAVLSDATSSPFGAFDTPAPMSQDLSGSVALTGWALDDLDVMEVQIWRQPHPSEPAAAIFQGSDARHGKVFIGTATLIDGARPDVEAQYALPNRSRAGWGYMLLTRGVAAWEGQGLFTLHAIALDRDDHVTEIGSTSISINNALATKPFGTIDTPGQGALASGLYANSGWVLSPTPGVTIPAANVRVVVDGVFLPDVPNTAPRSDVTYTFPGMDTSAAGRGLFIDTTAYADGLHTIAWVVTDSLGRSDGIGSRFFRIANGGLGSLKTAERSAARAAPGVSTEVVDRAPASMAPIQVRHGFDPQTTFETLQGSSEHFAVDAKIFDRVEVKLPASSGVTYAGYLRALGELRPMPAGAAIDPSTGTFTWQPGAGYLGAYDFVFVATEKRGIASRHEVRVTLGTDK
jgi:hypothetical protein